MKNYKQIAEAIKPKTVVTFFGRCNPPTPGHLLAFKTVTKLAKQLSADYAIVISRTQDKKSNPLSLSQKLEYLNLFFPDIQFTGASDSMRTPIEVLKQLNKTYKNIVFVCGEDRLQGFEKLFNDYNHKEYEYDSIKVVSAGERDPDSDAVSGFSATKVRQAAKDGDLSAVKKGLPPHVRDIDAKRLMNDVRVGMGLDALKESIKFDTDDLREKYVAGDIFLEGTFVSDNTKIYKIINRNSNYLTVSDDNGILSKHWLNKVEPVIVGEEVVKKFEGITEMKFSSSDKLKVAKIIGGMLGADVEKATNPEQIVNSGLKIARNKPLNAEAISILHNMLKTADEAGIAYDQKLVPTKVAEAIEIKRADFKVNSTGRKTNKDVSLDDKDTKKSDQGVDESIELDEVLTANHPASKWIEDFVKSDNPKFAGKSKAERTKQALAAYYAAQHNEQVEPDTPEKSPTDSNDIKAAVERAHISGERHITDNPHDQVIADEHHAKLNALGGKQVPLPTGHSLGGRTDQILKMKQKYIRMEAVDKNNYEYGDQYGASYGNQGAEDTVYGDGQNTVEENPPADIQATLKKLEGGADDAEVSDVDIEAMIGDIDDWDDVVDVYDPEELSIIDSDTGEHVSDLESTDENPMHESEQINEVLSRMERIKAALRFRKTQSKRERALQIALKRRSTTKKLTHKARSLAIRTMKMKLAKRPLNTLGIADKERIERIIARRKNVIDRMSMKLVPRIRQIEAKRLSHPNFTKPAQDQQGK